MDRRTLLRSAAALVTGGAVAGCTGADREVPVTAPPAPPGVDTSGGDVGGNGPAERGPGGGDDGNSGSNSGDGSAPSEAITLQDFTYVESDDGALLIRMAVRNEALRRETAYVQATLRLGSDVQEVGEFVSLTPGESTTVELTADVSYEQFSGNGGIDFDVLARTPATPLPTDSPTSPETSTASAGTSTAGTVTATGTGVAVDTRSETVDEGTPSEAVTE